MRSNNVTKKVVAILSKVAIAIREYHFLIEYMGNVKSERKKKLFANMKYVIGNNRLTSF